MSKRTTAETTPTWEWERIDATTGLPIEEARREEKRVARYNLLTRPMREQGSRIDNDVDAMSEEISNRLIALRNLTQGNAKRPPQRPYRVRVFLSRAVRVIA